MASNQNVQKEIEQIKQDIKKMKEHSKGSFNWVPFHTGAFEVVIENNPNWNTLSKAQADEILRNPKKKRKNEK